MSAGPTVALLEDLDAAHADLLRGALPEAARLVQATNGDRASSLWFPSHGQDIAHRGTCGNPRPRQ